MIKKILCLCLFLSFCFQSLAQGRFVLQDDSQDRINFKLINNLIVIPVEVNGVKLSFLLDTGVSKPIIFNFLNISEALQINQTEKIYLRGLGEGESVEALRSSGNIFKIGDAININQDLYAIFDPTMNFAPRLGVPVHGIIGYDFFKDFIVEVNYSKKNIKFHNRETYEYKDCKSCETLGLEFYNNKPYLISSVSFNGSEDLPIKLLIDSGGSDALWLFEDEEKNIKIPENSFADFLGKGLSGSVYGQRSQVKNYKIGKFKLRNVNAAFPDSISISYAKKIKDRSGSIAGNLLKRFNIIFDYGNAKITFKKNKYYGEPFYYNRSGITLEHNGVRVVKEVDRGATIQGYKTNSEGATSYSTAFAGSYTYSLAPSFTIVELRENSPAKRAGIEIGDIILNINGRYAHNYSLQELMQMFFDEEGKKIRLLIDRKGVQMTYYFRLESLL